MLGFGWKSSPFSELLESTQFLLQWENIRKMGVEGRKGHEKEG